MRLFRQPIFQLLTFIIFLVGSDHIGGPYIFFIYYGLFDLQPFAIIGAGAIATIISAMVFTRRGICLQIVSLILMYLSLAVFFVPGHFENAYVFNDLMPWVTLLLFVAMTFAVIDRYMVQRRYD